MSVTGKLTKEAKYLVVSVAILEVIEKDGLLGVTHSKVARKSGVSRAWIYEYIGRDKDVLIECAADMFGNYFSRANLSKTPKDPDELMARLKEGVDFLFASIEQSPSLIQLFFRFRGTTNPLGKVIHKYETHWLEWAQRTLSTVFKIPKARALQMAEVMFTLRLGLVHRFATSNHSKETRHEAKATLHLVHEAFFNDLIQ